MNGLKKSMIRSAVAAVRRCVVVAMSNDHGLRAVFTD